MNFRGLRQSLEPVVRRVLHFSWRFTRGMTLGVRAVVVDGDGKVFLVEHSYVSGWHLPGGGVETDETLRVALERELREEGNIELTGPAQLFGVYFNRRISRRDHVAVFIVRSFRQTAPPRPGHEIIGHGFFARDALPADTTRATRQRLAEVFDGRAVAEDW
jgi:ADP-ribose pyrophosphatase YjhB (NUDIX family)